MGDISRKVYFEVDGTDALSTFEQLKKIANESARSLIESGNAYSKNSKELNSSLEQEIRLRERKAKLEYEERKSDITDRYRQEYGAAKTDAGREKATQAYVGRLREVTRDEQEGRRTNSLLREVIETLRQTAREEIREDRKNVEQQVSLYRQGKLKDLSPEEEAKLKIQAQILGEKAGEGKEKSVMSPVFWGTLLGNLVPKIIERVSGVVTADSGERAFNSLVGAIPLIGGVMAETRERALQAREDLQTSRLGFQARGGRGNFGLYSGVGYGKTTAEMYELGSEAARARGLSGGNLSAAIDISALEKAYGLDKGQLLKLSAGERFGGGGAMQDTGMMISVLKNQGMWDKNSQTKIPEYLELLVKLQEEQIRTEGQVDNPQNMRNLMAMSKLGDKYFRDTSYITGISNALSNPQNEFQQARSLSVLSKMKPGGDLWELEMMQEKGLGQKGYMSGVVNQIKRRYGGGNLGERALYETLKGGGQNISKEDARRIYQESLKNPQLWDQVVDEDSLKGVLGKFSTQTRALGKARTAELTKDIAQSTDAYTQGALPGAINMLEKTLNKLNETLGDFLGLSKKEQKTAHAIAKDVIPNIPGSPGYIPVVSDLSTQIAMQISKFFMSKEEKEKLNAVYDR